MRGAPPLPTPGSAIQIALGPAQQPGSHLGLTAGEVGRSVWLGIRGSGGWHRLASRMPQPLCRAKAWSKGRPAAPSSARPDRPQ